MYIYYNNTLVNLDNVIRIERDDNIIRIFPNHNNFMSIYFHNEAAADKTMLRLLDFISNLNNTTNVFKITSSL